MRAVVVAGSSLAGELDATNVAASGLLVAVDAGADAVRSVGLEPSLFVGDMDSVSPQTREHFERRGTEMMLLPVAKDQTDLEAALHLLADRGFDDIVVHGALGGPRLDHLVGNVLLLTSPRLKGLTVRLVDDRHEVFVVGGEADVTGESGDLVSLLPLTAEVRDVRTEGLLYALAGENLIRSSTRGVSNEMKGSGARVSHGDGALLLIHYRGRQR